MPKSDDEIEQARSQFLGNRDPFANRLSQEIFQHGFPVLGKVVSFWQSAEQRQILLEFNNWVLDYLKDLTGTVDNLPDKNEVHRVAAVAVERILWGASIKKAKRFASIVASTVAFSEEDNDFEDAASFIRALDELSEEEIKVLQYLYDNQHQLFLEGRDVETPDFFAAYRMTHLIERLGKIGLSKEQFYSRCARLNGFGLSLPLERPPGTDPKIMAFRITELGIKLVELLKIGQE